MSSKKCDVCGVSEYEIEGGAPYSPCINDVSCGLICNICRHCKSKLLLDVANVCGKMVNENQNRRENRKGALYD